MISILGRDWLQIKTNQNLIEKIKQDYNFSEIISKLVISRKFNQTELSSIDNFLHLNNVFIKNEDFNKSIELVAGSINNKEKVCILGDYDVDGSAATSLFIRFFQSIKHPFFYYIPDREKDGYGASKKLFQKIILKKPELIIMVDCGSTSNEAIDFLNINKIKSLVIDHHEIDKPYPKANVIINPKKDNGYIQYHYFCATALVYFFLDLLSQKIKSKLKLSNYLIYVLLATVCDVMPIRKLNRLIALTAIDNFNINKNLAFNELLSLNNKKGNLNMDDLGYLIGPILNAGGRLGKSNYAVELLSSDNPNIVSTKSNELIKLNNKRKKIETFIINEIDYEKIENENKDVIIYYDTNINEGLIGIIAARLKDLFNKPAIVITGSKEILKGSARSIYDYNVGRAIKNALDKNIIINGGGHNMAAGFSLKKENLKVFEKFILNNFSDNTKVKKNYLKFDAEISSSALNHNFYSDLKKLEPFGTGNPAPIFLLKNLKVIRSEILKKKHILAILKSSTGFSIKSISFNSVNNKIGQYLLNYKKTFDVIGQISENVWNNKKTLQLTIRDLIK